MQSLKPFIISASNPNLNSFFLSFKNLEQNIQAFISINLDYCNNFFMGINRNTLYHLQYVQNCAAWLLTGFENPKHILTILHLDFKVVLFLKL